MPIVPNGRKCGVA